MSAYRRRRLRLLASGWRCASAQRSRAPQRGARAVRRSPAAPWCGARRGGGPRCSRRSSSARGTRRSRPRRGGPRVPTARSERASPPFAGGRRGRSPRRRRRTPRRSLRPPRRPSGERAPTAPRSVSTSRARRETSRGVMSVEERELPGKSRGRKRLSKRTRRGDGARTIERIGAALGDRGAAAHRGHPRLALENAGHRGRRPGFELDVVVQEEEEVGPSSPARRGCRRRRSRGSARPEEADQPDRSRRGPGNRGVRVVHDATGTSGATVVDSDAACARSMSMGRSARRPRGRPGSLRLRSLGRPRSAGLAAQPLLLPRALELGLIAVARLRLPRGSGIGRKRWPCAGAPFVLDALSPSSCDSASRAGSCHASREERRSRRAPGRPRSGTRRGARSTFHQIPKSREAGRAASPIAAWKAPNARPRRRSGNEVGDHRALGALGQREEESVEGEERPDLPAGSSRRRSRRRRDAYTAQPSAESRSPADSIRERPAGHAGRRLDSLEECPEQGQLPERDARVARPQQQKRIGRVGQRERREDPDGDPRAERGSAPPTPARPRGRETRRAVARARARESRATAANPGTSASRNTIRSSGTTNFRSKRRENRPDERARVVHRALQAEGAPANLRRRQVGEQRVARRGSDTLSQAVGEADGEHLAPGLREADERADDGGQERSRRRRSACDVGFGRTTVPRRRRGKGGRRLGDALDQPQGGGAGAERSGQEVRQERIDHVRGDVGEKRDPSERHDSPGRAVR